MIAGVLEYGLLGFGFHVRKIRPASIDRSLRSLNLAKFPKYIPGRHSNLGCFH